MTTSPNPAQATYDELIRRVAEHAQQERAYELAAAQARARREEAEAIAELFMRTFAPAPIAEAPGETVINESLIVEDL